MKPAHLKILLVVFALHPLLFTVRADTDAVTVSARDGLGYITGAVGFAFTPATNLAVTRVGYEYHNASSPIITIWSNTNFPIASYALMPGTNEYDVIYTNVSLVLLAGHQYSITLQEGQLSAGTPILTSFSSSGEFQMATQLTAYLAEFVHSSGAWTNYGTNVNLGGPNFSFQIQTSAIDLPALNIQLSNADTAIVSWPAPSAGFVLQENSSLIDTNWMLSTNTVQTANGTNQIIVTPVAGNRFYRLLHP